MKIKGLHPPFLPLVSLVLLCLGMVSLTAQAGQGQWTPIGPGKGYSYQPLKTVVADPVAAGTLWAALPEGGLYRSVDRGTTWRWTGRPFSGPVAPQAVAVHPLAAGVLWVVTREGLFETTDAGAHWTLLSPGEAFSPPDSYEEPVALWAIPGQPVTFYLRTYNQLLASFDGGQSWQTLLTSVIDVAVVPTTPATLYVVGTGWILTVSSDGGRNWTPLKTCPAYALGIEKIAASRDAIFVLPIDDERLGLLGSRDGGRTWQAVLGGRPDRPFAVWNVMADSGSPRTVWAIGGPRTEIQDEITLWVSRDGGTRWRQRILPALGSQPSGFATGPDALYVWTGGAVARSVDDGWTWSTVLRAPNDESPPSRLAFEPGAPHHIMLVNGYQPYQSDDGGRDWRWMETGMPLGFGGNDVWIDPARPGRMVAVSYDAAFITNDHGRSWTRREGPSAELVVSAGGRTLYAGGLGGVYRSRDGGRTWRSVMPRSFTGLVQKIEVDPTHPQIVYVLSFDDPDFYPNHGPYYGVPSQLWRSRDGGGTWRLIGRNIAAIALDRESSRLYATREKKLLVSDDGGNTWQTLPPLPAEVTDLAVPAGLPDTLYAAAVDGQTLLRSRDGGSTWERFNQGVPPGQFLLAVHPADGRTVYALSREGVFHRKLP